MPHFVIIGIHGWDVSSVNTYKTVQDENGEEFEVLVEERNVARVRYFLEDHAVDEDVPLPEIHPGLPGDVDSYFWFLKPTLEARWAELAGGANTTGEKLETTNYAASKKTLEESVDQGGER